MDVFAYRGAYCLSRGIVVITVAGYSVIYGVCAFVRRCRDISRIVFAVKRIFESAAGCLTRSYKLFCRAVGFEVLNRFGGGYLRVCFINIKPQIVRLNIAVIAFARDFDNCCGDFFLICLVGIVDVYIVFPRNSSYFIINIFYKLLA